MSQYSISRSDRELLFKFDLFDHILGQSKIRKVGREIIFMPKIIYGRECRHPSRQTKKTICEDGMFAKKCICVERIDRRILGTSRRDKNLKHLVIPNMYSCPLYVCIRASVI